MRIASALLILIAFSCSGKFVRKEEIQKIAADYTGVYALKEKIDIGNRDSLNKGAKVKIYFKTSGEFVSVYAYPYSQSREEAVGKNILQLFQADFPNKKFNETVFRERLGELIESTTLSEKEKMAPPPKTESNPRLKGK